VIPIFYEDVWFVCDNVWMGNLVLFCIVSVSGEKLESSFEKEKKCVGIHETIENGKELGGGKRKGVRLM